MIKRKCLSVVLTICMLVSVVPVSVWAEEPAVPYLDEESEAETEEGTEEEEKVSGECGDALRWDFDKDTGTLTISGTGKMEDYDSNEPSSVPWYQHRENITKIIINSGITGIGNAAFMECGRIDGVEIPDGVMSVGEYAFASCPGLDKIVIPASVTEFGDNIFSDSNNVTIYGYTGSDAEAYADRYSIPFAALNSSEQPGQGEDPDDKEDPDDRPVNPGDINLSDCTITISRESYVYDGTAHYPEVTVRHEKSTLKEDEDYILVYDRNINVGTGIIYIFGSGSVSGNEKKYFTISPKTIEDLDITYFEEVRYRGSELRPAVTITYGSLTLRNLTDYVLNNENNIEVGTAGVTITGTGNYTGEKKLEFTILPKTIGSTLARLEGYSFLSDGTAKTPAVIVMNDRERLVENRDYRLSYINNVKPGIAIANLEGIGNFSGTLQLKFTMRIGTPVISNAENTSSGIKVSWQGVSQADVYKLFRRVQDNGKWELVADVSGESYTDKKAVANGTVYQYKVYAVSGDVLSSPSGFWNICYLSRPAISSLGSPKSGQMTVGWKKNKKAQGYQIQYATKKNFSNAKTVTVSGGKKVKKTVGKLKANKKYYVRIRSYIRSYGICYSAWSKQKTLKTAK